MPPVVEPFEHRWDELRRDRGVGLEVQNPTRFREGDTVMIIRTGELVLVVRPPVPYLSEIMVRRGYGQRLPEEMLPRDDLLIVGRGAMA